MYSDLITPDINELKNAKGKSKNKRNKILDILENLESVFTGTYLHQGNVNGERIESIKGRLDEIKIKEQGINNELFKHYFSNYQSPSYMYRKLSQTEDKERNQIKVNLIKEKLSKLQEIVDYELKDNTIKIEENKKVIDIVEKILYFNN